MNEHSRLMASFPGLPVTCDGQLPWATCYLLPGAAQRSLEETSAVRSFIFQIASYLMLLKKHADGGYAKRDAMDMSSKVLMKQ